MPVYGFVCDVCGNSVDVVCSSSEIQASRPNCGCGTSMRRQYPPFQYLRPCYDLPENEAGNAKQRAWMETPEVQAKLKSGEYEIRKGDNR